MESKKMTMKGIGICPWCGKEVRAIIEEENYIRRDSCKCPECGERILVCRTPGCNNYAKGGTIWDDEICTECAKNIVTTGITILVGKVFTK